MTKILITVFLGGGLGSLMRYGVQAAMHGRISPFLFPWATLSVNILGSFLIGMFYVLSARFNLSDETRLFLTTGLCGGFTTFSTFSHEGMTLIRQGNYGTFLLYVTLSVALGVAAAFHPKRGIGRGGGFRRRLGRNNASRKMIFETQIFAN